MTKEVRQIRGAVILFKASLLETGERSEKVLNAIPLSVFDLNKMVVETMASFGEKPVCENHIPNIGTIPYGESCYFSEWDAILIGEIAIQQGKALFHLAHELTHTHDNSSYDGYVMPVCNETSRIYRQHPKEVLANRVAESITLSMSRALVRHLEVQNDRARKTAKEPTVLAHA